MAEASGETVTDDLIKKYKEILSKQLDVKAHVPSSSLYSREYGVFRTEVLPPHMSFYEKICNLSEKTLKIKVNPKTASDLNIHIEICHLQVSPAGVMAASFLLPMVFLLLCTFFFLFIFESGFFALFGLFIGIGAIAIMQKIPVFLANIWRMKTSNQMVLCIFYVVTYMRHTS